LITVNTFWMIGVFNKLRMSYTSMSNM